jgi:hypothetical protein
LFSFFFSFLGHPPFLVIIIPRCLIMCGEKNHGEKYEGDVSTQNLQKCGFKNVHFVTLT